MTVAYSVVDYVECLSFTSVFQLPHLKIQCLQQLFVTSFDTSKWRYRMYLNQRSWDAMDF